uniref:Pheromone-processing carboxypeptidase KEX1 n=1 Tax=Blastobotrys adeninivorans TaxID=409370 RepID=A0A060T255_BLAAD
MKTGLGLLLAMTVAPLVEAAAKAKGAADYYVWKLPGLDQSKYEMPIMHAGNIDIGKKDEDASLFFWHVASRMVVDSPKTVFWFNGGPGCSSMDGALMEIGPFRVKDKDTLEENPNSWHEYADLVFVDQPAGVGFSTSSSDAYVHTLGEAADELLNFLDRFFAIFPEKLGSDIYFAGESFAGQYIPYFARAVLDRNDKMTTKDPVKPKNPDDPPEQYINLGGLLIGNGWMDPVHQYLSYLPFAYSQGLVKAGSTAAKPLEDLHHQCADAMNELGPNITVHIDQCEKIANGIISAIQGSDKEKCMNIYDIRLTDSFPSCGLNWPPDLGAVTDYLRREDVLRALNTWDHGARGWKECSGPVSSAFRGDPSEPAVELLPELLGRVPILFFNGDKDFICNSMGNEAMLESMEWSGGKGFQEDEVLGEVQLNGESVGELSSGRNASYFKIYGASHMVPFEHGEVAQMMFNVFSGLAGWNDNNNVTFSGTHRSQAEKDKMISEATYRAYYRAGTAALIVVIIITGAGGYYLWKQNKQYQSAYVLGTEDQRGFWESLLQGVLRWKPNRRKRPEGRYFGLRTTSSGGRTRLEMNNSDIILEEDEEYNLGGTGSSEPTSPSASTRRNSDEAK